MEIEKLERMSIRMLIEDVFAWARSWNARQLECRLKVCSYEREIKTRFN